MLRAARRSGADRPPHRGAGAGHHLRRDPGRGRAAAGAGRARGRARRRRRCGRGWRAKKATFPEVYALAGNELRRGKLAEARTHLETALRSGPNDARTLTLLGNVAFAENRWPDAVAAYTKASELDPTLRRAAVERGQALPPPGADTDRRCGRPRAGPGAERRPPRPSGSTSGSSDPDRPARRPGHGEQGAAQPAPGPERAAGHRRRRAPSAGDRAGGAVGGGRPQSRGGGGASPGGGRGAHLPRLRPRRTRGEPLLRQVRTGGVPALRPRGHRGQRALPPVRQRLHPPGEGRPAGPGEQGDGGPPAPELDEPAGLRSGAALVRGRAPLQRTARPRRGLCLPLRLRHHRGGQPRGTPPHPRRGAGGGPWLVLAVACSCG